MAAIASTIIAGVSLLGTTIEQISSNVDTNRNVAIQISNFSTKYILKNPRVFTSSGYSHSPPQPTVRKGTMESCSFTKNPEKAYGCVGVLTYDVCTNNKSDAVCRLAIMFSVPYNYTRYENWFALGIFDANRGCDESLFNLMYYESGGPFIRDNCSGNEQKYSNTNLIVKGTMSPRAKAILKMELWEK
ncbi:DELTA-stichotoxin-Hcr4a-like [Hoplias malabaricus]|uniref:DELTA-stichotoxin-Hcr4a-like n=1 Tax=Hoplias malabaricus TaxID=27720 RepID=UPI003462AF07